MDRIGMVLRSKLCYNVRVLVQGQDDRVKRQRGDHTVHVVVGRILFFASSSDPTLGKMSD